VVGAADERPENQQVERSGQELGGRVRGHVAASIDRRWEQS